MIATVIKLDRGFPLLRLEDGREVRAEHATDLVKHRDKRAVVGDRVRVSIPEGHDKIIIEEILPRETSFVRKDPTDRALPQTLAANFDLVLIAQPLEGVQIKRLERELVLAYETGADVMVVLTKADLMDDQEAAAQRIEAIRRLVGMDHLIVVSQKQPDSIRELATILRDKTAILVGRSGVGKSSLVNMLVGKEVQETNSVREHDGKGRHTTVSREIIALPEGGFIVDMPGVRGLGIWEADLGMARAFSDIEALAQRCKFRDCQHEKENGCAVLEALHAGELTKERLNSYKRLREESANIKKQREEAQRQRTRTGHPRRRAGW